MLKHLGPALQKKGIRFVTENPEVILCNTVNQEILKENKPIIILERIDSATLNRSSENALVYSNVKAVFKNSILRPLKLHAQGEKVCGRYHFKILEKYKQLGCKKEPFNCPKELLHKIYCVPWHSSSSCFAPRFNHAKKRAIDFKKDRPIDVFFVGKMRCSNLEESAAYYCWHRKTAYEIIKSMKHIKSLVIDGSPYKYKEYLNKMRDAKIVVSPWGWGEWCYRDCEAMLSGCVLIKPDSSFVKTMPDLYQNDVTYVPCKPDFSDLKKKINDVLQNYNSYEPMRKKALLLMRNETTTEILAEHFATTLKRVLHN